MQLYDSEQRTKGCGLSFYIEKGFYFWKFPTTDVSIVESVEFSVACTLYSKWI